MTKPSEAKPNNGSEARPLADAEFGVVLLDVEGRILEVCSTAERVFDLRASELRGRRVEEFQGLREQVLAESGEACRGRSAETPREAPHHTSVLVEVRPLGDEPTDSRETVLMVEGRREAGRGGRGQVLGRMAVASPLMLFVLEPPSRLVLWMARTTAEEAGLAFDSRGEAADRFFARILHPADVGTILAQLEGRDSPGAALPMPASFRIRRRDGSWRPIRNRPVLIGRRDSGQVRWLFGVVEDSVSELDRVDEERSGRILGGVSEAANALLSLGTLTQAAPRAIGAVASAIDAESATVRQFKRDEVLNMVVAEARWEWRAPTAPLASTVGLQQLPLDGRLARWLTSLVDGQEMSGTAGWLPVVEQEDFDARGILSAFAVPIGVHATTWGFLEFADGRSRREWVAADRDAARVLASLLGHAIERARADRRLRTLSRAVEQSPSAILIADARARIEYINPKFTEVTGWPAEEVQDHDPATLRSRNVEPRLFGQFLEVVKSGREWSGRLRSETRSGAGLWFEVYISPVRDGTDRITHYIIVEEDVTARMQAEEKLRAEKERYRFLFDSVPALVGVTDPAGACLGVNRRWHEFTGRSEVAAAGEGWLAAFHPEDRESVHAAFRRALTDLHPVRLECRVLADGDVATWHLLTAQPILGPEGSCDGLLGACVDITAVKDSEGALFSSREELRALASRLVSIREEERRLLARELHDGVGQELTGLAMELSSIDRSLGDSQPEVSERLRLLSREVTDALSDVRDLARRIRPAALDVGLVAALEGELRAFERRSGLAWELRASEELEVDPERSLALFRFVQEALTNVVRHAAATAVHVSLSADDELLRLEVADDGRGVDPEAPSTRSGLGLVGLRERVAPWRGSVRLEPNTPFGTRAIAEIPFRDRLPSGWESAR